MKITFIVALLLGLISTLTIKAESILRIPRVSVEFGKQITSLDTNHCVLTESRWSNPSSSINQNLDYFVVGSVVREERARVLVMNPFTTDSNGVVQPPRFTDTVTGETRVLPYQTVDDRKNGGDYYHHGILSLGDDKYYVVVAYEGDMQHPVVSITWGKGSDILNPGDMLDSFEVIATETVTEQKVTISKVAGQDGVPDGVYLFVDSPKSYGEFKLMESSDLGSWKKSDMVPYIIYGYSVIYKIDIEKASFFKVE